MGNSEDHRRTTRIQGTLQDFNEVINNTTTRIEIKAEERGVLEAREHDLKELP